MQREKEIHMIEVHVAGLCIRDDANGIKFLIGKRADDRQIFPGYWECGGGQVHVGETFPQAIQYHMKEEFGIEVEVLSPFCTYFINLKDKFIPGLRILCRIKPGQKVNIDNEEIVAYEWVSFDDLDKYEMIPGLKDNVRLGIKTYEKLNSC